MEVGEEDAEPSRGPGKLLAMKQAEEVCTARALHQVLPGEEGAREQVELAVEHRIVLE